MDAKITKGRLGHLLSYDWLKMAGLCAIAVVLCLVLFTTIAARASAGQIFEIFTYAGVYTDEEELGDLDKLKSRGALSYEVLDMSSTLITADTGSLLFSVRFAAGEGDIVVTVDGGGTQDENGNYTALEGLKDFLYGYRGGCYSLSLDGKDYSDEQGVSSRNYFTRCEQYLGTYFRNAAGEADWREGTRDESALHTDFLARVKGDRRRSRRDRVPTALLGEWSFSHPSDFLSLLPPGLPEPFTSAELAAALGASPGDARMYLYLLHQLGLLDRAGRRGNFYLYVHTTEREVSVP